MSTQEERHMKEHEGQTPEQEAQKWIETLLGIKFPEGVPYEDVLRDGVILCEVMNKLAPGSVHKVHDKSDKEESQMTEYQNIEA